MTTTQTLIHVSLLILKKTWYIVKGILLFLLLGGIGFIIVWQYYDKGPWRVNYPALTFGPIALALILVLYPKVKRRTSKTKN